jgi:hypothetical protein
MANRRGSEFNGHKNWNHWNVSFWLNNDERLYKMMTYWRRIYNLGVAATKMRDYLQDRRMYKTPDGAPYSISAIKAAMRDI